MKFSVLMSVYINDKPEYLSESLDSILKQTVKPDEIVLVLDGEIAKEVESMIATYQKQYPIIKLVKLEKNSGLGIALREGLKACSYDLVARMDADDICVLDRFEKQLKIFEENPNVSIVGGYISEFIENIENCVSVREVPLTHEDICQYLKARCPLNHMTVMFKKADVEKSGSYREWYCNEDYYLWIRMYLHQCEFRNLGEILVHARVGEEMYRRRGGLAYFKNAVATQKFMLQNHIIHIPRFIYNICVRFTVQVLCPNSVRAFIYKHFARRENAFKNS